MRRGKSGQTAIEYLVLLTAVVAVVLIMLNTDLGNLQGAGELYFNKASEGIIGQPPTCGNGSCDQFESAEKCCVDCGGCN